MWYNGAGGDFLTHLLVVDDEVSILELIKNSLGKDGYLITVCQNADDVIQIYYRKLIIFLEVLKCRQSLMFQGFPAFLVTEDVLKSP